MMFPGTSNLRSPDFSTCLTKFENDTLLLTNFSKNFDSLTKHNNAISKKEVINLDKIKKFLLIFIIKLIPILENFIILSKSSTENINKTTAANNRSIIGRIISEIMSVKSQLNKMISLISLNVSNFSKSNLLALIDLDNSIATLVSMNSRTLPNKPAFSSEKLCVICKSRIDPEHDKYAHHRRSIHNIIQKGANAKKSSSFSDNVQNISSQSQKEDQFLLTKLYENGRVVHEGNLFHKDCYNWWGWNIGEKKRRIRPKSEAIEPLILL